MTHAEQVRQLYEALMFSEQSDAKGVSHRVINLMPSEIEAMEVWQAAAYFNGPTTVEGAGMAVASHRARERGEKLEPAPAVANAAHGDAIAAALAEHRARQAVT